MNNEFFPINPELFKGKAPQELTPQTYYAYIDSIEKIDGTTHLRLDCIVKNHIDNIDITEESVVGFPSIVLDISGSHNSINELFHIRGIFSIYDYESNWVVITTILSKSELNVSEFYNFVPVGESGYANSYTIDSLIKNEELDNVSGSKIAQIIKATTLEESNKEELQKFLSDINNQLNDFSHINVYNVGQGNCNAFVDKSNLPLLYFDVGGGVVANKSTYPSNFRLCHTNNPQVILSHWDLDHIVTAVHDPVLLRTKWLVPVQASLSNTANQIARALQRNHNLICWNTSLGDLVQFGNHYIAKCKATVNNKNSSGLCLYVNYGTTDYVLLPGDATFKYLPQLYFDHNLIGLVASHHGAKSSIGGMPLANGSEMLVYSFGNGNTYSHAHAQARNTYLSQGWGNGLETTNGSIAITKGLVNFNTPCVGRQCALSVTQQF